MLGSDDYTSVPEQPAAMLPYGVADSDDLAVLAKVFNDYCAKYRVVNEQDREAIALKIMCLFRRGLIDPDQLSAELERVG
ncbi:MULTISPECIES: hypothetical protein [unclassified Mesorhizobium]|uniref:hypothetical protein n=2 Tax=unclassified Mesorhizobium TaxID=325217 RepID=UPI002417DF0E|nr:MULTISPECIES: hypothetical protein [unclassified Mesorhizobium]MDG4904163.1 hypothetical protein [Mesorhizobium sp. WSM4962]